MIGSRQKPKLIAWPNSAVRVPGIRCGTCNSRCPRTGRIEIKVKDWNILVTVQPGPQHTRPLLSALRQYGEFHQTHFRDVCIGRVTDIAAFLESVRAACEIHVDWTRHLSRVIPVERTFRFTPDTLVALLKDALAPFAERIDAGSIYVRLERRGLANRVSSPAVERAVADHVFDIAEH